MNENPEKWGNQEFFNHFKFEKGRTVTLAETGNLREIIDYYFYDLGIKEKINQQIIQQALQKVDDSRMSVDLEYKFDGSYGFAKYMFCFGGSIVRGEFRGNMRCYTNVFAIEGIIEYEYFDTFTDPIDLRQWFLKITSDPKKATPKQMAYTELGGTFYNIVGRWATEFKAEIPRKTNP